MKRKGFRIRLNRLIYKFRIKTVRFILPKIPGPVPVGRYDVTVRSTEIDSKGRLIVRLKYIGDSE